MRFSFDSEESEWRPEQAEPRPKKAAGFDHDQRVEFLRLLHDGLGRTMACAQVGIDLRTLNRALGRSPAFRQAVEHVEQVRADNLFTGLYVAALKGDTRAARFLLTREDRALGRRDR